MHSKKEDLYFIGPQRTFDETATEAAFLLGGIGTGNISIGARGQLRDWEIFNRPAKGQNLPYSFFALWARAEGQQPIARVLEARLQPPYNLSHGFHPNTIAGLPRLAHSTMRGEYPIATIDFDDPELPLSISLEAYTPFIPLNPDDSGIPIAIFTYTVRNISDKTVDFTIAASLMNAVGYTGVDAFSNVKGDGFGGNINEYRSGNGIQGLFMHSVKYKPGDLRYGNMSLATFDKNITVKKQWLRSGWWDCLRDFWDDFSSDGRLDDHDYTSPSPEGSTDIGTVGVYDTLMPGQQKDVRFMISWYFPNRIRSWDQSQQTCCSSQCSCSAIVRNRYAALFDSSWDAACYAAANFDRLHTLTHRFRDTLFSSTLPYYVLDALSANITVIRSTTCMWLEDGTFLGYEGCFDSAGCCDGNCTHVWNYAQTMAFLFPTLERNMRYTEFAVETEDNGKMNFRAYKVFGEGHKWANFEPAADGQCGSIMRLYREWKLSGDNGFLESLWPNAKRAMDFACSHWDTDSDGVPDGKQHNTYDIEFYGPNPLTGVMFLGALKACAEMANAMGDHDDAERYAELFKKGSRNLDKFTWNGEYYIQKLDNIDAYKYQFGQGCLADQLLGQWNAHIMGLGYLLPEEHVKQALSSVFRYNFCADLSHHANCQRTYALNDEKGLLACTWPHGGRPKLPFPYSDEIWTGSEYHVAAHLIREGFIDEGLAIVKAVRDRHDGVKRNPWDEVECGHHYARSMSSWGLIIALSGFMCDMVNKVISFNPVIKQDDFCTFWSTGTAWGIYSQKKDAATGRITSHIEVLYGDLDGVEVKTPTL